MSEGELGVGSPHVSFIGVLHQVVYKLLLCIFNFVAGFQFSGQSNELFLFALHKAISDEGFSLRANFVVLLDKVRVEALASVGHSLLERVLHDLLQENVQVGLELSAFFHLQGSLRTHFLLVLFNCNSENCHFKSVSEFLELT